MFFYIAELMRMLNEMKHKVRKSIHVTISKLKVPNEAEPMTETPECDSRATEVTNEEIAMFMKPIRRNGKLVRRPDKPRYI